MEDRYQAEIMDELRMTDDERDQQEHKREGYFEHLAELAEVEYDRIREGT